MSATDTTNVTITANGTHKILVIEDERDIARLVQMHLNDAHHHVEVAHDGTNGLERALEGDFDLVILDLMLPGIDGLEICRRLRARSPYVLILMLTSKGSEFDRVLGLEIGADDYLPKPFFIRELLARVRALFRRSEAQNGSTTNSNCPTENADGIIHSGDLTIEVEKRKATLHGDEVALTAKEFDLLHQFACHPGRVYTRTQLLDSVWGLGYEGYEHTVNSHINRLRAKIEADPTHPRYLLTVWGVGYKFADGEDH